MTAWELLRKEAASLRHAVITDDIFDCERRFLETRTHHYLTCKKCELERKANELERNYNTNQSRNEN
jgi:hypothetical protein